MSDKLFGFLGGATGLSLVMAIIIAGPVAYQTGIMLAKAQDRPTFSVAEEICKNNVSKLSRMEGKLEKASTSLDSIIERLNP